MKITCDSCGAKYSIADDKVKGKVFKIRCKKCTHVIVVKGGGSETAAPETAATTSESLPSEAIWHAVLGRDQVGPITAEELRTRFAAGEISGETFIWREGFADWVRLHAASEFSDLFATGSGAATSSASSPFDSGSYNESAPQPAAGSFVSASVQASEPMSGGVSFAEPEMSTTASALGAKRLDNAASPALDLFGSSSGATARDSGSSNGKGAGSSSMTGQRGENSVLFSLANLQALAMKKEPAPVAHSSGGNGAGPIASSGSGSGLIDIRALSSGSRGDVGLSGGVPGAIAVGPVVMPRAVSDRPAWLIPVIAVGALVVVGIVIMLAVLLKGSPETEQPVIAAVPSVDEEAEPDPDNASPHEKVRALHDEKKAAARTEENDTKAAAPTETKAPPVEERKRAEVAANEANNDEVRRPREEDREIRRPEREEEPAPPPVKRKRDDRKEDALDELISGALGGGGGGRRERPSSSDDSSNNSNLPEQLTRSDILRAMSGVKDRVQSCYDQYRVPGTISLKVKVNPSGDVDSTSVAVPFDGTPTGECVMGAVRRASFPAFSGPAMTFTYPFRFFEN